jgi:DNA-binding response OmpR family regulator
LRAILRRGQAPAKVDLLRFGRLEVDRGSREVRLAGEVRPLTSYQFALLLALAEHAGRVMSRDALMELLKAHPFEAFDRSIDVHISRIRAAIEDDAKKPRRVITVRGVGYVFAKAQD